MSELLKIHPFHNISNHNISNHRLPQLFNLTIDIANDAEDFLRTEVKL